MGVSVTVPAPVTAYCTENTYSLAMLVRSMASLYPVALDATDIYKGISVILFIA